MGICMRELFESRQGSKYASIISMHQLLRFRLTECYGGYWVGVDQLKEGMVLR